MPGVRCGSNAEKADAVDFSQHKVRQLARKHLRADGPGMRMYVSDISTCSGDDERIRAPAAARRIEHPKKAGDLTAAQRTPGTHCCEG